MKNKRSLSVILTCLTPVVLVAVFVSAGRKSSLAVPRGPGQEIQVNNYSAADRTFTIQYNDVADPNDVKIEVFTLSGSGARTIMVAPGSFTMH